MKRNKLILSLSGLLLLTLIIASFSVNVQGANTLDYTFENEVLFDSSNISYDSTFNFINLTESTEIYNGTYTFDNEVGLTSDSIDFIDVDDSGADTSITVLNKNHAHDSVLDLHDYSAVNKIDFSHYHAVQTNGTIEYWFKGTDLTKGTELVFYRDITKCIQISIIDEYIKYYDVGWHNIKLLYDNVWYHIKIDFECSSGSYKGLAPDKFYLSINSQRYGPYNFRSAINNLNIINFITDVNDANYHYFYDAIGYSWDSNYTIGDNIIPYFYYTDDLQIKADEFAFNSLGEHEAIRILNDEELVNGWEIGDTQNDVSIIKNSIGLDKEIRFYSDTVHSRSLTKSLTLTTNEVVNLTMIMTYLKMENDGSSLYFGLFRSNTHEFSQTRLYYSGGDIYLQSMDRDRGGYTNLCVLDDSPYLIREFNFLTDEYNTIKFSYKDSSGVNNYYTFPKIIDASNYYELVIVASTMNDVSGTQEFHIDSLSIAVNGSTLDYVEDFASHILNLNVSNWNAKEYNLFNINASGYFGFGAGDNTSFESIRGFYNYTESEFINCYSNTFNLNNPYFSFITDKSFNISSILIEGVKLNEGGYSYPLFFTHASINPDNNYFRVDSYNRLQFTLTVTDDNLEYIQATFNVNDVATENRSISFASNINGDSKAFLSLDYTDDTINLMEFPYHQTTTKVILPQTKTIKSFTILITDNNLNNNDRFSGYITNICLLYNPDIGITILTLDLLGIIVPLIVMLIPSIIMGKKFGITGTIITFVLMALVCVIGNLIPIWMFFIIAFCCIGFLLMKEKIKVKI